MQKNLTKRAVVWSQKNCQACHTAKITLVNMGYTVEERILDQGWTKEELLKAVPGARTVPQIFVNDQYVGDFKDLRTYLAIT
jgi:glutaredoxin